MKCCSLCKQSKPLECFYWQKDKNLYTARCRKCLVRKQPYNSVRWKQWYENKGKTNQFYFHLKKSYGLSKLEYDDLVLRSHGRCSICSEMPIKRSDLCVDHSHATDEVRGLLCRKCNAGLGQFKDSKQLLLNAVSYLERV